MQLRGGPSHFPRCPLTIGDVMAFSALITGSFYVANSSTESKTTATHGLNIRVDRWMGARIDSKENKGLARCLMGLDNSDMGAKGPETLVHKIKVPRIKHI